MNVATTPQHSGSPTTLQNRQHLAWGVLLIAFSIFCTLGALVVIGVHYFIFQSTIPLQGTIQVSRGTASLSGTDLIEQYVRNDRDIGTSGIVTTDPQSQALVVFRDQYSDNTLIADVTLKNGATLYARQFVRPRFDWSTAPYWIHLTDIDGEFDINVPDAPGRAIVVTADTSEGATVRLNGAGQYTVSVSESQLQVVNKAGDALVVTDDMHTYPIPVGQRGSVQFDDPSQVLFSPTLTNLLGEDTFSSENVIDINSAGDPTRELVWRCNSLQNSGPEGHYSLVNENGIPAMHLFRGEGAESHGETNCVEVFGGTNGIDVTAYSHLSIRATFKITSQSLSACGAEASECPLMLRMDYRPAVGDPRWWIHGFYASINPDLGFQLSCDTCNGQRHEIINLDRWYTYESDNLLTTLSPDSRPVSILNMRFYASGHQYDVYVRSVELLVDQTAVPLPNTEGQG